MKMIGLLVALLAMAGCAVEPTSAATPEEEEASAAAFADARPGDGTDPHPAHLTAGRGPAFVSTTPPLATSCAGCGPGPQPWNGGAERLLRPR